MMMDNNARRLYHSLKSIFLHIDQREKALLSQFNLTIPRFYILTHVHNKPGLNYIDLSELMLCTKGNTTRVVGGMQSDGLITRHVNPQDRRSYRLYLTEKGENLFKEVHSTYIQQIDQILEKFTEDQLAIYTEVSAHIEAVLEPKRELMVDIIDLQHRSKIFDVFT